MFTNWSNLQSVFRPDVYQYQPIDALIYLVIVIIYLYESALYFPYPIIKHLPEGLTELCLWNTSLSLEPCTGPEIHVMSPLHLINEVFKL